MPKLRKTFPPPPTGSRPLSMLFLHLNADVLWNRCASSPLDPRNQSDLVRLTHVQCMQREYGEAAQSKDSGSQANRFEPQAASRKSDVAESSNPRPKKRLKRRPSHTFTPPPKPKTEKSLAAQLKQVLRSLSK